MCLCFVAPPVNLLARAIHGSMLAWILRADESGSAAASDALTLGGLLFFERIVFNFVGSLFLHMTMRFFVLCYYSAVFDDGAER